MVSKTFLKAESQSCPQDCSVCLQEKDCFVETHEDEFYLKFFEEDINFFNYILFNIDNE